MFFSLTSFSGVLPQWTAKGASRKGPHQKTPNIVKTCQDKFQQIAPEKPQNSQKMSRTTFGTFRQVSRGTDSLALLQKNPRTHKIKSAIPPSQNEEFYGHGFSCRKNACFPGAHKIGAATSGPRIVGRKSCGREDFSGPSWEALTTVKPSRIHVPLGALGLHFINLFSGDYISSCFTPWTGKSCFSNRALVKTIFEAPKCI